jgi:hypothetical protein
MALEHQRIGSLVAQLGELRAATDLVAHARGKQEQVPSATVPFCLTPAVRTPTLLVLARLPFAALA